MKDGRDNDWNAQLRSSNNTSYWKMLFFLKKIIFEREKQLTGLSSSSSPRFPLLPNLPFLSFCSVVGKGFSTRAGLGSSLWQKSRIGVKSSSTIKPWRAVERWRWEQRKSSCLQPPLWLRWSSPSEPCRNRPILQAPKQMQLWGVSFPWIVSSLL